MNPIRTILLILVCLNLSILIQAQNPNRLIRVKIPVPVSSTVRLELITMLQLDHFQEENGFIETEIGQSEMNQLSQSRFGYQVLVEDVGKKLEEINKPYFEGRRNGTIGMDGTPLTMTDRVAYEQPGGLLNDIIRTPSAFVVQTGSPNLGGYYTYAQMITAIENLYNTYSPSGIVDTFHIGSSVQGRIIYAIKISDNAATDESGEPEVFFQGIQHAREAIGGSSMIFTMQYLCEEYATNTRIKNLVDNREIYIIVCMNPDGWEYNRSTNPNGGGGWRKNRRVFGGNVGVDLNRNWSTDWGNCAVIPSSCASNNPADDTYYGTAAFSEPETQAVRNFIRSKHIVAANDQHSVGPYYSLPFGRPGLHTGADSLTIMQQQWYTAIPALMGKYNGMRAGNSFQALGYEVAGGVKDWMLKGDVGPGINGGEKYNILGMTGEGGYGTGVSTFWPAATSIVTLCKGMTYQNLQMIYSAGSYVDIQDMTDIAVTATSGNFSFKIKRLGIENQPVTVSLVPVTNVTSVGTPVVVNTLTNYYDTYTGNISYTLPGGITNGQRLRFAWKVETAGYTYSDTITKLYNPTQLFYDNMEGANVATNWVISAGWNYVADSGYAASRALTESPGTSYPASITTARTARYNGSFNLTSATAAYLTFQTRHKAENFRDKLQVQVSTTGINGTWIPLAGKTTVREPGTNEGSTINGQPSLTGIQPDWVKEEFNLSAFLGSPSVLFRFAFTSNASSTFFASQDEGFYIDELKVVSSSTPLVTLGANFLSFDGRLLQDNTVELKLTAEVDQKHSYFEVEKSSDRQNFVAIGRLAGSRDYSFIDRYPFIGNNYYRIREVDIDGKEMFSKIINIVYSPSSINVLLYPNPVKDELNVRLKLNSTENVSLQINDLTGRIIKKLSVNANNNGIEHKIDTRGLSSNMYILKVINSRNEVISVQKFVKQ